MDTTIRTLIRLWRESEDPAVAVQLAQAVSRADRGESFGIVTIPALGSRLTLVEPWTFSLHNESRNSDLWEVLLKESMPNAWTPDPQFGFRTMDNAQERTVTLPAGTVMRVDRIYIRNGSEDYDSVTFVAESMPGETPKNVADHFKKGGKKKVIARFWATLQDVNRILCEWHEAAIPRAGKKKS